MPFEGVSCKRKAVSLEHCPGAPENKSSSCLHGGPKTHHSVLLRLFQAENPEVYGPGGVSWGSVLRALFSPRPLHARSRPGSAVDMRFSLITTSHMPPGLHRHYSALRQEPAKVSGEQWAECGGCLPRNLGSVLPCAWLQFHRRLAWGANPLPALPCVSDSCSPGVGAFVSCNSCVPLASASWWARWGLAGGQPSPRPP